MQFRATVMRVSEIVGIKVQVYKRLAAKSVLFATSMLVASCGFLPADGPRTVIVTSQASNDADENAPYRVIKLTQDNIKSLSVKPEARLLTRFGNKAKCPCL